MWEIKRRFTLIKTTIGRDREREKDAEIVRQAKYSVL